MLNTNKLYFLFRLDFLAGFPCCKIETLSRNEEIFLGNFSKDCSPYRPRTSSVYVSGRSTLASSLKSNKGSIIIDSDEKENISQSKSQRSLFV